MNGEACRLELLGTLRALPAGGRAVTRFRTAKTAALLAFLAFYSTRSHPREVLCEMFWPDADEADARNSLSKALGSLRNQLEPPGVPAGAVIVADRQSVALNAALCRVDTAEWDAALARARRADRDGTPDALGLYQSALTLYAGELLPGLYDDWCLRERERLTGEFVDASLRAAALAESAGDASGALSFVRRAIAADPLREAAHALLVGLLVRLGDSPAAAHAFAELSRVLRDELGAEPSPETRALLGDVVPAKNYPTPRLRKADPLPQREGVKNNPSAPPSLRGPASERGKGDGGLGHSSDGPASRLPLTLTRFFGREEELARLQHWLAPQDTGKDIVPPRLVTVTGPGGTGKTRLTTEAARLLWDAWHGNVWWASLAEATDAALLTDALGTALETAPADGGDALAPLVAALGNGPCLLVLDNFEQLLDANRPADAAQSVRIVQELLARVPRLTCLVTSRQRLGLPGEQELALSPLPAPDARAQEDLAALAQNPCVALFVDRAQSVRPDFQITDGNAADVAALCEELDGIPLAMELAAARAQVLSPSQMRTQLTHRFQFLSGRQRGVAARHQTIQAAAAWSYDLLAPELVVFAARLSVFRGGWSLDAAEAVTHEPLALDFLSQLVECSLVVTGESGDVLRFRQLETLREYGDLRLSDADRADAQARHAGFFCGFAEQAEPQLYGPQQSEWLGRLEDEHDNLRAALRQAQSAEHVELGLRLGYALWRFWYVRGHLDEGRAHLSAVLASPASHAVSALVQARACVAAGSLARMQGDHAQARLFLERGTTLARGSGDADLLALTLNGLGLLESDRGENEAATVLFAESLALRRTLPDTLAVATSLNNLGTELLALGRYDDARPLLEESITLRRAGGDVLSVAHGLNNLGLVMQGQGDWSGARGAFEDSLATCRLLGDTLGMAAALDNLTETALLQKDSAFGRVCCAEALALREASGDLPGLATSLEWLAALTAQGEETILPESKGAGAHPERAATLWAAASALRERIAAPLPPSGQVVRDGYYQAARDSCPSPLVWERAERLGRAMTTAQAVAFARADL